MGMKPEKVDIHIRSYDFTLDLDGKIFRLSEMRGKIVFLDFMYTRCGVCREEVNHLKEIYRRYADKVIMISISIDTGRDTREDLERFAEETGSHWDMVLDTSRVQDKFGVSNAPATIIIDGEGFIRFRWTGLLTIEEISYQLDRLMNEQPL